MYTDEFFTSSNGIYSLRVKAGDDPKFINQPCLSIFGTAIPQHFYEALSSKMLSNGFFARMLIAEAGRRGQGQKVTIPPIPDSILSTARWWRDFQPGRAGNLGTINPMPVCVPATSDAQALLEDIRRRSEQAYNEHEAKGDQMGMAIWARAAEKVHRLALIWACSEKFQAPLISIQGVDWAWKVVEHQTRRMIAMAKFHVYEGEFDQKQKKAVQAIKAKGGMMSQEQLTKTLRTLPCREREDVISNLVLTGQIIPQVERTSGRPKTIYKIPCREGKVSKGKIEIM